MVNRYLSSPAICGPRSCLAYFIPPSLAPPLLITLVLFHKVHYLCTLVCLPTTARQNLRLHPQWIFLPRWGSFWSWISMRSTPNCHCLYIHYFSCILLTICKFTSTCVFIYVCLSWRLQASRGTRTLSLWFTWGTQDSIDWVLYLWSKWRRAISGTGWQVW